MFLPFLVMIYSCSPQQSPGLGLSGCSISQNRVRRAADSKPTHVVCLASHRADTKTFFFLNETMMLSRPRTSGKESDIKHTGLFLLLLKCSLCTDRCLLDVCVYTSSTHIHIKLSLPNVQYCV